MTFHEILAVVSIAEEAHAKPVDEGGHGGPLTISCMRDVLRENARPVFGIPPSYLTTQFKSAFPRLLKKGWLEVCDPACGGSHFMLTDAGQKQLQEWNEKGCGHENVTRTRGRRIDRECVAAAVQRERRVRYEAA